MRNNKEENTKETIVGTFTKNKSFGFVVPDNKKISKDIFISKKYFSGAKSNDKVVVQITKPEIDGNKPEGKIIEILGNINIAGVDMLSIIREYKLPYEFPKFVIDEARKIEKEISLDEIVGRKDFRNEEIFTVLDNVINYYKSNNLYDEFKEELEYVYTRYFTKDN